MRAGLPFLCRIRVAVRRPDLAGHVQPLGFPGQIMPVQCNLRYPESVAAACAGVFLLALLVGALLTHLLVTVVRESGFSPADRTLGGGLGMVRAVIVVSLFVLVGGRMGAAEAGWWQESALIGQFEPLAQGFANVMPEAWLEMIKPTANPNPSPGP